MSADLRRLNFDDVRDADSDTWDRSRRQAAAELLETATGEFLVKLDGDAHICQLEERADGYWGLCTNCDGFQYHQMCAHLALIRKAAAIGEHDDRGNRVTIPRTATATERHARADGGGLEPAHDPSGDDVERPGDLETEGRWTGR